MAYFLCLVAQLIVTNIKQADEADLRHGFNCINKVGFEFFRFSLDPVANLCNTFHINSNLFI